jgi:signal transduction histidine kinase
MSERVRLLEGRLDVESKPGGPTRVTAAIPRWRPPS